MSGWSIGLNVRRWAARAPGLVTPEDWLGWSAAPWAPVGPLQVAIDHVPASVRRRIDPLGRAVIGVALEAGGGRPLPLVFATRHASLGRTLDLLGSLVTDLPLSPTGFALSVHNAAASTWTIVQGDRSPHEAISAGPTTVEAAAIDARLLLDEGADEVLLVCADELLPDAYAAYGDEPDAGYAWAAVVAASGPGPQLTLAHAVRPDARPPAVVPHGLDVLRLVLGGVDAVDSPDAGFPCRWRRG